MKAASAEGQRAQLLSVATAVPRYCVAQSTVAAVAHELFGQRFPAYERMARVFETSGIQTRHMVKPLDWYQTPLGWRERTAAYLEGAQALFVAAAEKALALSGCRASDVDTIVTISSTGLATPSLEARVLDCIGFRTDIERVPVFGLGCAGGVSGLALAARLAEGRPGSTVLMVAVEICTAAFRLDQLTKANLVATALFGDGAAACVVRTGAGGIATVEGAGQHTWPETLDVMGWNVDSQGLSVVFDRDIPPFVDERVRPAMDVMLGAMGIACDEVDRFACHPGGAKVLLALERALHLDQGSLTHERAVLSQYGNMSAPTVLFVLERLAAGTLPDRTVLVALGPGFSCGALSLVRA